MIDFDLGLCYNETVTKYAHNTCKRVWKVGSEKNNIKILDREGKTGQKIAFAGKMRRRDLKTGGEP